MLKIVETFNHKKRYVVAAVRVSVEEHFVLCEVRNFCKAVTAVTVSVLCSFVSVRKTVFMFQSFYR